MVKARGQQVHAKGQRTAGTWYSPETLAAALVLSTVQGREVPMYTIPLSTAIPHHAACCRYDSHRDQILKSGERHQAGAGGDFGPGMRPDDEVDLFSFFNSSCYSGFGDGPKVQLMHKNAKS